MSLKIRFFPSLSLLFVIAILRREFPPFLSPHSETLLVHAVFTILYAPSASASAARCKYANPDPLAPIPKFSSLSLSKALPRSLRLFYCGTLGWKGANWKCCCRRRRPPLEREGERGGRVCKVECSYPLKSSSLSRLYPPPCVCSSYKGCRSGSREEEEGHTANQRRGKKERGKIFYSVERSEREKIMGLESHRKMR